MSDRKRWSVDDDGDLEWSSGPSDVSSTYLLRHEDGGILTSEEQVALVADVRAAARLRSLAAIYEQPLNRGKTFTFTGRELAAMLKEEG